MVDSHSNETSQDSFGSEETRENPVLSEEAALQIYVTEGTREHPDSPSTIVATGILLVCVVGILLILATIITLS